MALLRYMFGAIAILALSLSLTGVAIAQQSEETTEDKPLEEVVVTAQKKEEAIRDVPSSVAVLSGEELNAITTAGQDIRLLSARVPSLLVESSFGRTLPRFYIRGLGNTDFDLNASQPVSLVYDGVVLENPILKGYPIYDMERIEVLRGPQGTLFGRNTPAGIVKFESRKPRFESDAFFRASFGTYNTTMLEGAVGGPVIANTLAVRASFLNSRRSDWVDNTFTGQEDALGSFQDSAGRFQLLYTPGDVFSALFNVHMRDLEGTARLFQANIVESGSNSIRDDFKRDEISIDGQNQQTVKEAGGVLTMDLLLRDGSLKLTSVTGLETGEIFSRGDIDGGFGADFLDPGNPDVQGPGMIPFPSESADGIPELTQVTQEFRLASASDGSINYLAGFFYFDEDLKIDSFNYDTLAGGVQNAKAEQEQNTQAWALFGTLDWQLAQAFKLSGGVRYSDETKDFTAGRSQGGAFPGQQPLAPESDSRDSDFVSWDVNGLWTANPDVNVYGRVARSFRAPSFQGRLLFGDEITVGETEKIISYEIGTKANLGAKARGNLSLFYYVMNDQQLTAVGGDANVTRLMNAEKTEGSGFELEFEWLPHNQLFFTLGTSYNKTEIKDPNLGVIPGSAAGLTVLDDPLPGTPGAVSIDGNILPNAPEWIFDATLRASVPAGNSGEVYLYTDWAYRSEVSFFLYESTEFTGKGFVEGGLRVGYASYEGNWEFALWGRNITDTLARTGGIDFNNLVGFVNEPRTVGLEAQYRF